jgi:pSer/pThr/pTyr-binding forkhead associated (FHA) protein
MDNSPHLKDTPGPRFVLWVDGVGGYLVCQGDVVTLGQPVQGSYVDVPVLGDISRLHATIRRLGESYVIEPTRATHVNGRAIDAATLLADGSEIELGDGVQFRFRLPNPLSRTARLDFISRHRTLPTTDGVILMAESCILGPNSGAHIVCRDWPSEVVLFPQKETLRCRAAGGFQVDGVEANGQAAITRSSQIVGEDFSLSLEKV